MIKLYKIKYNDFGEIYMAEEREEEILHKFRKNKPEDRFTIRSMEYIGEFEE